MNKHGDALLLIALVCAIMYLLYLDWRRQGEIDYLAEQLTAMLRDRKEPDGTEAVESEA